jgi:hypothetical protein
VVWCSLGCCLLLLRHLSGFCPFRFQQMHNYSELYKQYNHSARDYMFQTDSAVDVDEKSCRLRGSSTCMSAECHMQQSLANNTCNTATGTKLQRGASPPVRIVQLLKSRRAPLSSARAVERCTSSPRLSGSAGPGGSAASSPRSATPPC